MFPLLLLLIIGGVQGALWYHARTVALAAAQEGARAAGAEYGSTAAGVEAAGAFLEAAGGGDVLTGRRVTGTRTAAEASVTVSGTALTVLALPGLRLGVTQSASVPVERISG